MYARPVPANPFPSPVHSRPSHHEGLPRRPYPPGVARWRPNGLFLTRTRRPSPDTAPTPRSHPGASRPPHHSAQPSTVRFKLQLAVIVQFYRHLRTSVRRPSRGQLRRVAGTDSAGFGLRSRCAGRGSPPGSAQPSGEAHGVRADARPLDVPPDRSQPRRGPDSTRYRCRRSTCAVPVPDRPARAGASRTRGTAATRSRPYGRRVGPGRQDPVMGGS